MKNGVLISFRKRLSLVLAMFVLGGLFCGYLPSAAAQDGKPAAAKKTPWTAEDVVNQEGAAEFEISPDARFAVWVKAGVDKEKDERVSNLFISPLSDGKEVQLTRGAFQVSQPK